MMLMTITRREGIQGGRGIQPSSVREARSDLLQCPAHIPAGPPTVQPGGQAHSPVMWWQVPPFWQGQRSSQ